jgi:hypothetical protein
LDSSATAIDWLAPTIYISLLGAFTSINLLLPESNKHD